MTTMTTTTECCVDSSDWSIAAAVADAVVADAVAADAVAADAVAADAVVADVVVAAAAGARLLRQGVLQQSPRPEAIAADEDPDLVQTSGLQNEPPNLQMKG